MPSLTERRHQQTRAEIAAAAVALFGERGFDAVTMDDVAAEAGTSRRTVYRHFASKDDLVFEHPRNWVRHFDEVTADAREGESAVDRCLRGLRSVAAQIDATAEPVLAAYQVYLRNPSLRGSHGRIDDEWFTRFFALVDADLGETDDRLFEPAVAAGALVGTINGLLVAWAGGQPDSVMVELAERALTRLDPILPAVELPNHLNPD